MKRAWPLVAIAFAAAASLSCGADPPDIPDETDRAILEAMAGHARDEAQAMTVAHFQQIKEPEMLCWVDLPKLNASLTAYGLTGDVDHLRNFSVAVENLRATLQKGSDGFLGWEGRPIPPLIDPAKPNAVVNEIQAEFRAVTVLSRFLEIIGSDEKLSAEFGALREPWLDLMTNHLVKKWDVRGAWKDLDGGGAVYCWNPDYTPLKANITLAHEKQAHMIEALLGLWRVTGDPIYGEKARKLGAWLKQCLRLESGRYAWNYWDPAGPWDKRADEPSKWKHWIGPEPKAAWHAATVRSAVLLHRNGLVFDETDIDRFVATQLQVCWNGDSDAPEYFLTNGSRAKPGESIMALDLAPFDAKILAFLFEGARQRERFDLRGNPWHGGVLAAPWLEEKYLTPRVANSEK